MQVQTQLEKQKIKTITEMDDFKKIHSETFLYFLEEFEKWTELKKKAELSEKSESDSADFQ